MAVNMKAMLRSGVLDNLDLIARLLNIDVGPEGTREDILADIIRIMLFEKQPDRESPSSVFRRRLRNGDFQPLQVGEDPDNLPPLREPMDGTGFAAARGQAELDSVYWAGNTWLSPNGVISSVILRS